MAAATDSYSDSEDEGPINIVFDLEEEASECEERSNVEEGIAQHEQERGRERNNKRSRGRSFIGRRRRGGEPSNHRKPNLVEWTETEIKVDIVPFIANSGPTASTAHIETPRQAFEGFFTDEMLGLVVRESNKYAYNRQIANIAAGRKRKAVVPITENDMRSFVSVVFAMGVLGLSNEPDYWSNEPVTNSTFIRGIMSREKFHYIKRHLNVASPTHEENTVDRLAKVRPLLTILEGRLLHLYIPNRDLSLDEAIMQCGHRIARISHRAQSNKPLKDFIKAFTVHEAGTGYCCAFKIDTREGTSTKQHVLDVLRKLPSNPYRVAIDRYYSSVDSMNAVLDQLGFYAYGTIRTDRGVPTLLKGRPVPRPGVWPWVMAKPQLLCVKWRDTSPDGCYLISTCYKPEAAVVTRRVKGQGIVQRSTATLCKDYNETMGGSDQGNALRANYSCQLSHQKRWYLVMVYYVFEIAMCNAFILYNAKFPNLYNHKSFCCSVIRELAGESLRERFPVSSRKRQHLDQPLPEHVRLDGDGHYAIAVTDGSNLSCVVCYRMTKRQKRSHIKCSKCNVPLCVKKDKQCFITYHTVNNL